MPYTRLTTHSCSPSPPPLPPALVRLGSRALSRETLRPPLEQGNWYLCQLSCPSNSILQDGAFSHLPFSLWVYKLSSSIRVHFVVFERHRTICHVYLESLLRLNQTVASQVIKVVSALCKYLKERQYVQEESPGSLLSELKPQFMLWCECFLLPTPNNQPPTRSQLAPGACRKRFRQTSDRHASRAPLGILRSICFLLFLQFFTIILT